MARYFAGGGSACAQLRQEIVDLLAQVLGLTPEVAGRNHDLRCGLARLLRLALDIDDMARDVPRSGCRLAGIARDMPRRGRLLLDRGAAAPPAPEPSAS